MKLTISSNTDTKLSWRISKRPGNVFERELSNNSTVVGKFVDSIYVVEVKHDLALILKHCRETNKASYNDAVYWVAGPYNLKGFNEVFRSVLRGEVGELDVNETHDYLLEIGPVSHYDEQRIAKLTDGMGLAIQDFVPQSRVSGQGVVATDETSVRFLQINATMPLTEFLQKVYIFLYAYQYQYTLSRDSNDKLAQLKKFFGNWIDGVTHKNYLIEALAGKRLYKLAQLDEAYGNERVATVEAKVKASLHLKRHAAIADVLSNYPDIELILDAGCGNGKLVDKLDLTTCNYVGFDVSLEQKSLHRRDKVRYLQTNLLYPWLQLDERKTAMILSEVIEHLDESQRQRLYMLVNLYFQPDVLIITTPNQAYNVNYPALKGLRHPGHKVEFTKETFEEVQFGLYSYRFVGNRALLDDNDEMSEQPSFVAVFERFLSFDAAIRQVVETNLLPFGNDNAAMINRGLCQRNVVANGNSIFYLGPQIAPAASDEFDLESLTEAVNYYAEHNVTDLVFQVKKMGSRAYALWFADLETAYRFGYTERLVINSRSGYRFFDDETLVMELWTELSTIINGNASVVMLDCEVTPWRYKAEGLIQKEFDIPLNAEHQHRLFDFNIETDDLASVVDVELALNELSHHAGSEPLRIWIFDVLVFDSPVYDKAITTYLPFFDFTTKHFSIIPTKRNYADLIPFLRNAEGVVIKPRVRLGDILPAIKVRNPNFLRLIYGAHYDKYLSLLSDRPLSKKRRISHQQREHSKTMIHAFFNADTTGLLVALAQFLENDATQIDATL